MTIDKEPEIRTANKDNNRRKFIKTAGIATLGAAAAVSPAATLSAKIKGDNKEENSQDLLKGRTVLITGAARGIGKATAKKLAHMGANIALVDIANANPYPNFIYYNMSDAKLLEQTHQEIDAICKTHNAKAIKLVADVRNIGQMKEAVAIVIKAFGSLDGVVANAGIFGITPHDLSTAALHKDIFDVNVDGVLNTVLASQDALKKSKYRGRIVILSSIAGRRGIKDISSYTASKWAVTGMMKSFADELGPHNITVNCVAPTGVRTTMTAGMEERFKNMHPLPVGLIEPEDVAGSIFFLLSDHAKTITGSTIDVNAGLSTESTA